MQVPRLDIGQRNWILVEHPGYKSERVVVRPDQWKPLLGAAPDSRETHRAAIHVTLQAEKPDLVHYTLPGVGHAPTMNEPPVREVMHDFLRQL